MILHLLIASGGDVHPLLDPHKFGLVFWTGITFTIVLAILYKKAWGPLLAALDAREQGIAGQKTAADKLRGDAEALRAKYEAQLEGIRREAQQIISEGEQDKKRILDDAHKAAVLDAQAVKERGERDIQLAKSKALSELKKDAVHLGMAIAEKVIAAEVDAARHRAVVDEVISSYERR